MKIKRYLKSQKNLMCTVMFAAVWPMYVFLFKQSTDSAELDKIAHNYHKIILLLIIFWFISRIDNCLHSVSKQCIPVQRHLVPPVRKHNHLKQNYTKFAHQQAKAKRKYFTYHISISISMQLKQITASKNASFLLIYINAKLITEPKISTSTPWG